MKHRTPADVGAILRRRRERLNKNQDQLVYVSAATVRKLEAGTEAGPQAKTLLRLAKALRWPEDMYERLLRGEDPAGFPHIPDPLYDDEPVTKTSSVGIDEKVTEILDLVRSMESNLLMIAAAVLPVDSSDPTPAAGSGRRSPSRR